MASIVSQSTDFEAEPVKLIHVQDTTNTQLKLKKHTLLRWHETAVSIMWTLVNAQHKSIGYNSNVPTLSISPLRDLIKADGYKSSQALTTTL